MKFKTVRRITVSLEAISHISNMDSDEPCVCLYDTKTDDVLRHEHPRTLIAPHIDSLKSEHGVYGTEDLEPYEKIATALENLAKELRDAIAVRRPIAEAHDRKMDELEHPQGGAQ